LNLIQDPGGENNFGQSFTIIKRYPRSALETKNGDHLSERGEEWVKAGKASEREKNIVF